MIVSKQCRVGLLITKCRSSASPAKQYEMSNGLVPTEVNAAEKCNGNYFELHSSLALVIYTDGGCPLGEKIYRMN
jgi:hypothetical protein